MKMDSAWDTAYHLHSNLVPRPDRPVWIASVQQLALSIGANGISYIKSIDRTKEKHSNDMNLPNAKDGNV